MITKDVFSIRCGGGDWIGRRPRHSPAARDPDLVDEGGAGCGDAGGGAVLSGLSPEESRG